MCDPITHEYMSAGLPVIASDFPLWRQIIDGAGCGLLVNPMNPEAIASAMRWILEHPAEAEEMGNRGRKAVESTYNWDTEAAKLKDLYKKLLAQRGFYHKEKRHRSLKQKNVRVSDNEIFTSWLRH